MRVAQAQGPRKSQWACQSVSAPYSLSSALLGLASTLRLLHSHGLTAVLAKVVVRDLDHTIQYLEMLTTWQLAFLLVGVEIR